VAADLASAESAPTGALPVVVVCVAVADELGVVPGVPAELVELDEPQPAADAATAAAANMTVTVRNTVDILQT